MNRFEFGISKGAGYHPISMLNGTYKVVPGVGYGSGRAGGWGSVGYGQSDKDPQKFWEELYRKPMEEALAEVLNEQT